MAVPSRSTNFADLLDSRFKKIFNDQYGQLPDRIPEFFQVVSGADSPTKDTYRVSQVGAFGDLAEFTGNVTYDDVNQGYDTTLTHVEYASGFQVERKLFDDELYGVMDAKPRGLSSAYARTRQKHAAGSFNNAFSVVSTWMSGMDSLSLCNDAHTTTSGASTTTGFDNLSTATLTATALAAARIQMRGFRDDRANRISVGADLVLIPVDLYADAYEIVQSQGKPDTANNNANVHFGQYRVTDWEYLTDTNNWFLIDSALMKQFNHWVNRVDAEFAMVEDFDTILAKWRLYCRYAMGHSDWRWVMGHQVS